MIQTTVMLGLESSTEEKDALLRTMEAFNAACGVIAGEEARERFDLHRKVYRRLRDEMGLASPRRLRSAR